MLFGKIEVEAQQENENQTEPNENHIATIGRVGLVQALEFS